MAGEAAVTGAMLLALRDSRHLTRRELARELRRASGEPLARELIRMIWAWETGKHTPNELHMRAYQRVFPELAALNGTAPPGDLAALAADLGRRAAAMPGPAQVTALEAAALARVPAERADEIRAMARAAIGHMAQAADLLRQIGEGLEGGAGQ